MRNHRLALLLLIPFVACRSSSPAVSSTYDPLIAFPSEALYAWDDARNKLPDDEALQGMNLDAEIREVADAAFAQRGYQRVTSGSAHYRLSYSLDVTTWIAMDASQSNATLSFLLVEAASGRRVWLGFARAPVLRGLTPAERRARMEKAMAELLKNFPPKQR